MTGTDTSGPLDRRAFWSRALRGWDIGFSALVAVAAVSMSLDAGSVTTAVAVLGALAVLVVGYVTVGRRGILRGDTRMTTTYVVLLCVVVCVEVWLVDLGPVLLFVAYSQIWFFSTRRLHGILWSVALTAAFVAVVMLREELPVSELPVAVGQAVAGLVFSIVLGLWVTWVSEQSEERAALLERLEAVQDELAQTHHATGVLAERARVAQEIHDTLAQGFTSVVMLAQTAAAELERGRPEAVHDRLTQIEHVARDNLAEARALVAAFGPPGLEHGSLADALDRLARRFEAETHVRVEVAALDPAATGSLAPESAVVLLRAAQEALANVRRHAGARRVRLELTGQDERVRLEVTDDGRGLPEALVEGVGLRGMRERADAGGGSLEVGAAPGGGTRVRVTLPAGGAR
ncbi:two-component sensor histidine kinase [Cellulomonas chitinilytica]|uniref:Oxygen sensor histidine kinase NreB n=1 Tax=Cellulomonas chitinilytica TaxID=398759 RepID=A0A919U0V2_9CELL|nr:sensor histidine kinase [Cellulomonas chitinilytica]GIG22388.1 two-component sensor histidine kinase [Cellulomonas chitinilytica]